MLPYFSIIYENIAMTRRSDPAGRCHCTPFETPEKRHGPQSRGDWAAKVVEQLARGHQVSAPEVLMVRLAAAHKNWNGA
jgi:hypothetical protein